MYLVLEDGSVYPGRRLGAEAEATGEVVFNTSMTGYQEMLTDPSYGGQILVPTYPLIGNYGTNPADVESRQVQVNAFVVRSDCDEPSHPLSEWTIHDYLLHNGIPGVSGVDTRAITRKLRSRGVMMGIVTPRSDPAAALQALSAAPRYGEVDVVDAVSTEQAYEWNGGAPAPISSAARSSATQANEAAGRRLRIVVSDYGVKQNILRCLTKRGCDVTVVPDDASADEILRHRPDGVLLSPGPGDPVFLDSAVETVRGLSGKLPIMGICLGHQVVARAFGANTFKLKFGHRGGNQPVKDMQTGRVYVTAQNHGYAVDSNGLPADLRVSHMNLNDNTVEGLRHANLPIMTIQYHSEASPGPHDSEYLFDRFVEMVREMKDRTSAAASNGGASL
ncbi:MAG: glutamine-hydrolyzing carbamoyl-phosphate synthase small subunit [Dehalococcoidia bacterium]